MLNSYIRLTKMLRKITMQVDLKIPGGIWLIDPS